MEERSPRKARPRDVRAPGFPSPPEPMFGGRMLNALTRRVEVPYPSSGQPDDITPEERRRVEEFIGCTLEQSFSEFTMELKNSIARMLDDMNRMDQSKPARHRRGAMARKYQRSRAA